MPKKKKKYKSKKKSIEDSLGIEDINTNPYDTTEDPEKCLRNSEEIMKISSFLDAMESLLSDNSSKSSDEIKREIRKALLEKLENLALLALVTILWSLLALF